MTKRTKIFKNAMLTLVTAIAAWMSFAADFTGDETWSCRRKHLAVVNPVCATPRCDTISLRGEWQFLARTDMRTRRNSHDVPSTRDA